MNKSLKKRIERLEKLSPPRSSKDLIDLSKLTDEELAALLAEVRAGNCDFEILNPDPSVEYMTDEELNAELEFLRGKQINPGRNKIQQVAFYPPSQEITHQVTVVLISLPQARYRQ